MVRVLIVDDHPVFRDGMATLVDRMPSYTVVAQAESQVTAMRAMRQQGLVPKRQGSSVWKHFAAEAVEAAKS